MIRRRVRLYGFFFHPNFFKRAKLNALLILRYYVYLRGARGGGGWSVQFTSHWGGKINEFIDESPRFRRSNTEKRQYGHLDL